MYSPEAYAVAAEIVQHLRTRGVEYGTETEEVARVLHERLMNGDWSGTTDFELLPDLRIIEGNEFENYNGTDDFPDWDDQIGYVAGYYLFFA